MCSADLTVPVLHGAIIEGVATLICRLGSRLVALKEPQYDFDNYMVMVFKDCLPILLPLRWTSIMAYLFPVALLVYTLWRYATAIDSFIATSMVCAAFSTSGGYLNPVLATSLKFGCRGHTPMEVRLLWAEKILFPCSIIFNNWFHTWVLLQPQENQQKILICSNPNQIKGVKHQHFLVVVHTTL